MGSCETSSGSCGYGETQEARRSATAECESRCGCGSANCGGDPTACATAMWSGAFIQAMKQVHVDLLKAKIQKAWGSKLDKAADAVLEAMGAQWESMLAQAKAKQELRGKLAALWQEGRKP